MEQRRPIILAKTGLHYDRIEKNVRCHVCQKWIDLSEGRHPQLRDVDVHEFISPSCPFVNGTYTPNVPVPEYSQEQYTCIKERQRHADRKWPEQVHEIDDTASLVVGNGNGLYVHSMHVADENDRLQGDLATPDTLLPSPAPTPCEIYKAILEPQLIADDGVFRLKGRNDLVIK